LIVESQERQDSPALTVTSLGLDPSAIVHSSTSGQLIALTPATDDAGR
jgi:hypothetical protein